MQANAATSAQPELGRRRFLRLGAGNVVAGTVGLQTRTVGQARAIAPLAVVGAVALGAGAGWAVREFEILGSDDVPEGLTPEVLREQVYQVARKRKSVNQSTFVDNRNIIDTGMEHAAYSEAKLAAIEGINAGESREQCQQLAREAIDQYEATVLKNLLKSWNESVAEFYSLVSTIQAHEDASATSLLTAGTYYGTDAWREMATRTLELPDGQEIELNRIHVTATQNDGSADGSTVTIQVDLVQLTQTNTRGRDYDSARSNWPNDGVHVATPDGDRLQYLARTDWRPLYEDIRSKFTEVRDGVVLWLENVYDKVQAGELDSSELLSNRDLAQTMADDEAASQGLADLMALNVAVDLEREAEIYLPERDATLYGSLSVTSEPTGGIQAGDQISPSDREESYYLTYDVSRGHGTWSAFESGVDGGVVTFTQEPLPRTLYQITTVDGETVEVGTDAFSEDGDAWTADLSEQLETPITEIESVRYYADTEQTNYETIQLTQPFEVVTFRNSDGSEVESAQFDQAEPHTDENYITQEEWQQFQQRQKQLVEEYEDAKNSGFSIPGLGELEGSGTAGAVVLVGGGLALANFIFN